MIDTRIVMGGRCAACGKKKEKLIVICTEGMYFQLCRDCGNDLMNCLDTDMDLLKEPQKPSGDISGKMAEFWQEKLLGRR